MSRVLFLPLAIDKSLQGRSQPLPLTVAARQIPRQLAELIAGKGSLHTSYMPLVGNDQGRRGFVGFEDLVPLEQLTRIFQPLQQRPDYVIDGLLGEDQLELRLSAPGSETSIRQLDLPFDPNELQALLNRLVLELWELFDLPGRPSTVPPMNAEAFACFLAGRDEELAAQANLTRTARESAFLPFLAGLQHEPGQERILNATLELARLYIEQGRGDSNEACQSLAQAAQSGEAPLRYLMGALTLVRQVGNFPAIAQIGVHYLRHRPKDAEAALLVGAAHWSQENIEGTRILLTGCVNQWSEEDPQGQARSGALALLAEAQRAAGDRSAEKQTLALLRRCKEWTVHAAEFAARTLSTQESAFEEALQILHQALESHPKDARLLLEKGHCLLLSGKAEDARQSLLEASSGPPETAIEARRLLSFVEGPEILQGIDMVERLLHQKKAADALRIAKKTAKLAPKQAEPQYLIGLAHSQLGQVRRAVRALRKSLELDPRLAEARNRLGILLVSLGRYREAYSELKQVLQELPNEIGPLLHMAQACYYLRRFDEGREFIARAEKLQPEHPMLRQTKDTFYSHD
ncbi:MAG: hypothetical protein CSA62_12780 [Planctomycetota bacterium]|nr:MAG: hypothetical protein CSA62_12780 [Planctomycetota bacterium]